LISVAGAGWIVSGGLGRSGAGDTCGRSAGPLPAVRLGDFFASAEGRAGRLDRYSKVGLAAIALAVRDAGWPAGIRTRTALVAATAYGCLATDEEYYRTVLPQEGALASPNLFAYTLPNCFLGEAALRFGFTGPTMVLGEERPDGLAAVTAAVDLLEAGAAEAAICGGCDLERPAFLPPAGEERSGAVFLALEREEHSAPLARLVRTRDGLRVEGGTMAAGLDDVVRALRRSPEVGG
jgi:3-oxoacyl-[acyl-carrier-protein] synthase II